MRSSKKSVIGRPRHRALIEMRRLLKEGREFPDGLLPSEHTLSKRLGTSQPTTHRALSQLSDEGLLRCEGRQWLITSSTRAVTVRKPTIIFADDWHDMNHPSCALLLKGIMTGAERHGFKVEVRILQVTENSQNFKEKNPLLWEEIEEGEADGLIMNWITDGICKNIRNVNPRLTIVSTQSRLPDSRMASVIYDWRSAGFQTMRHLLENGAKKIRIMNLIENDFTAGCKDVLADAPGTTANFQHEIVKMDDDMEALALRLAAEAPDAMAFSDDRMAGEVLKACIKIIPHFWEKTKVVSSDNLGWKSVLPNQVVRILFDPKMLGEAVMTSMAALLDGRPGANSVVLIKPKLVE